MDEIVSVMTGSGIGVADLVGFLAMLAAVVPNPKVQAVAIIARKLLDMGAFNWGKAKNAADAEPKKPKGRLP